MHVPVFCDTCGAVFRSGLVVEDSANETFAGKRAGPCPVCGRAGHVPEGALTFLEDAIAILSAPQRTTDELTRLAEILSEACQRRTAFDEIVQRINGEIPELSGVTELVPAASARLYTFFSIVVAVSALLSQAGRDAEGNTNVTVDQAMDHIFNETNVVARSLAPRLKPRRNEPCPCGSGKPYKRCCGRLA